ncbi:Cys-tRNA(Pro) deacylase, prolyl-tRNA editing enzyme YbaK/EbsC [Lachnospiraceae bacterium XBB1006]|nr:Cys-tRNA(Pro) deacylase, prolyl-tRNA editing enzyme YbaK/EbsC [Lachnospiraceae bacterium XBB1006]
MSFECAKEYVTKAGFEERVLTFEESSATVELAAAAVGTEPGRIAKSLTFKVGEEPIMILCAGDKKIDNSKYKHTFHAKAKMLTPEEVLRYTGHAIGGVCPFGMREAVRVYLDESLKAYDEVYPACGSGNSAVRLSIAELSGLTGEPEWVDVCK